MAGDMNVALTVRLIDRVTSGGQKIGRWMDDTKRRADALSGSVGQIARQRFSTANLETAMARSERNIAKARGRLLGAAALATTIAAPVFVAGNFEEELIQFGNLAEIGAERLAQVRRELDALRPETGQSNNQLLAGLEAYVGKGMGLDEAMAALRSTARLATTTRSDIAEGANSGFALMDNLKVEATDLAKALDIMAASGKLGSFELGAMARNFPTITASARALGVEGVGGVASLSAALQIAMKAAGSEDQAANNLVNFLGKLTAPDTLDKFSEFGVDVEKELQIAIERGTDPLEHMLDVINRITGGNNFKMGELFADKQVLDFLRAAIPNLEEYKRIRDASLGADGVIDADYERVMAGFNQSLRGLGASFTSLLGGSGALLPIFTELIQSTTVLVDNVAAWTQANPELTGTIVKVAAALVALSVGTTVMRYGVALLGGGLLRTASLFLKFNEAGRNVSVVGRMFRGLRWGFLAFDRAALGTGRRLRGVGRALSSLPRVRLSSLLRPLQWTRNLIPSIPWARLAGRLSLRTLVKPLEWVARWFPRIPWASFVGRLALASLIVPLKWTAGLLPVFAPALARFQGFRRDVSTELSGVELRARNASRNISRTMSSMRMTAALGALGMGIALSQIPDGADAQAEFQRRNRESMEGAFRATPGLSQLMDGYDWLDGKMKGMGVEPQFVPGLSPESNRPASPAPDTSGASRPAPDLSPGAPSLEEQRQRSIRTQLSAPRATTRTGSTSDVQLSSGAPSLEEQRQRSIRAQLAVPRATAGTGATSGVPLSVGRDVIATAIREGVSAARQPPAGEPRPEPRPTTSSPRPEPRPQEYVAPQPNVEVQSSFESSPSYSVSVAVSMPVTIQAAAGGVGRKARRDAARQAGAETERAIRRGLDDAAVD